jgi:hypothetical protein
MSLLVTPRATRSFFLTAHAAHDALHEPQGLLVLHVVLAEGLEDVQLPARS